LGAAHPEEFPSEALVRLLVEGQDYPPGNAAEANP